MPIAEVLDFGPHEQELPSRVLGAGSRWRDPSPPARPRKQPRYDPQVRR
jgi:hypothetical protein